MPLLQEVSQQKFGVCLGTSPVRRVLRLSGLTPPRPQRRAAQVDRGRVQERWFAALAQRAQERVTTIGLAAESGLGSPCGSGRTGGCGAGRRQGRWRTAGSGSTCWP